MRTSKSLQFLVIEEPESFLHPSAQAEFGRVVQDLSEELQIQVIVATHSPYFLSHQKPESNVLLKRAIVNGKLQATQRVPVSSNNWMEPFALNLGLANPEFEPWKGLFFSKTDKILLVEGKIDKEYFEMLRASEHGSNKLDFSGEIYAYDGKDTLANGVLLKFIKGRYSRFFVMYDLDAEASMNKLFTGLDMEKHKHFCSVGLNTPGHNKIEGLLPKSVCSSVYGKHASVVQQAMSGTSEEAKSAKGTLKKLLLEEFKNKAVPGQEYYGEFYKLSKIINKAMN